jgi:hypothetical protein
MIDWIKSHKIYVIGGIVALIIFIFILRSAGGSGGTAATGSSSDVAAATALQQAQLAAGAQGQQVAAAQAVQTQQTAAQLELGKLQIAQAGAHDTLAAQVATSSINATQQTQSLLASLSADIAKTNSNNDVAKTQIASTTSVQMQQILATALTHQSDNQATIAQAGYSAQLAAQQSHDAHSGGLFGGGGFLGLGI